jgi:hypothetical protein
MADDDPVRLELDEIRDRAALAYASPKGMAESGADVPRLVETITALLDDHKPVPLYAAGPRDKPCDCGHDFDAGCHDEGGNGAGRSSSCADRTARGVILSRAAARARAGDGAARGVRTGPRMPWGQFWGQSQPRPANCNGYLSR